ncbi:hypothetical protein CLLI_18450 [Clostridium liquoris]|jgi:ferredoxin-thioredoxin reductase catalytic subunit|uniref:Phospholipase C/D domain-containing protein n=1 Tax=Clostridium liquoris TaxID=1289519 RepID=A0A2T0B355_9CLOT|nr:zinc dependent phospholipase C family protein [Clostridium liquoris]PRR78243.1 hypothetical protein CLLI_18450 [Clostridium liquoris]
MPDAWTHILASNEIIKGIESSRYRSILEGYIKFYQCGSQGPDIFLYYCNLIPSKHNRVKKELGQRLHTDKTGDFIVYLIDKLKQLRYDEEYNMLLSYVLGYITHYALDTSMHPFIYYFGGVYHADSPETKKYDLYHKQLEKIIGIIQLENKRGASAYHTTLYSEVNLGKNVPRIIDEVYSDSLYHVYNLEIKSYLINYCYKDMKSGIKFLTEPNMIKNIIFAIGEAIIKKKNKARIFIYPRRIVDDLDYLNKEHKKWNHPCYLEEVTYRDAEQLYMEGINKGINLINTAVKYLEDEIDKEELIKTFPNLSYESGKLLDEYKKMLYFQCIFEH